MDPTIELLNEVWSGARTGLTSLRAILDITDDTNLRNEIYRQETIPECSTRSGKLARRARRAPGRRELHGTRLHMDRHPHEYADR